MYELIIEAKRTFINFQSIPYDDMLLDMHYLQIKLVQQSLSSIITTIQFFLGHNSLFPQIDELLSIVFHSSAMIRIRGNLNRYWFEYQFFDVFNQNEINKSHLVNIQQTFKIWYNITLCT
ncbi:unnamed protein product [Rotaria socialis]|uniref:Uncharacterized protein n=2 Tax=Rotaria socialis TaxID=392032 RepID=A0A820QP49_9BILA|nr:unnamed protein product [Rotaria socialis]CAF3398436.1 unnamed protein product [Rotaria socialis]CAF3403335.1 unnamed protein product [Rotaria socialis]CAF3601652.1 unnamed protein product [Rotaria socialis]CAF4422375.1 unnamed protein product [Rotaria socialis]